MQAVSRFGCGQERPAAGEESLKKIIWVLLELNGQRGGLYSGGGNEGAAHGMAF